MFFKKKKKEREKETKKMELIIPWITLYIDERKNYLSSEFSMEKKLQTKYCNNASFQFQYLKFLNIVLIF